METSRSALAERLKLIIITDRSLAGRRGCLPAVRGALQAGATCVELRDKQATSRELLEMAVILRPLVDEFSVLFVVNDRFDIALAAGAHGVHLGEDDPPVSEVRRVVPRNLIIGRSADTEADAQEAAAAGADYIGVGSVFGTATKPELRGEVIGTERLARGASAVSIPVVGIGGITADNASQVLKAGAVGVAVVSAVMGAADPLAAAKELWEAVAAYRLPR